MKSDTMRDKILDDYIEAKEGLPARSDYHAVHERNLESFEMMFLKLIPSDKNARILDVGCGCGQLLYMLRSKGYTSIKGVDIGSEQVRITKGLGIEAERIDDLASYLARTSPWDAIILSQVIEHFPKDKIYAYMDAIRSSLGEGGRVIIATPNMALLSGAFQRYIDFTHEIGFTERSLYEVLRASGFSDIAIYPEAVYLKLRPKFLIWVFLRSIWFGILSFIYLLERGSDRPRVISRHLIAVAKRRGSSGKGRDLERQPKR